MSVSNMKKLTAFSCKKDVRALLRKLTYLRCVDVRYADVGDRNGVLNLERFNCIEERSQAEERVLAISRALKVLYPYSTRKKSLIRPRIEADLSKFVASERYGKALATVESTERAVLRLASLDGEEKDKLALYSSLLPFKEYPRPLGLSGTENTVIFLGSFSAGTDFSKVEHALESYYACAEKIFYKEKVGLFVRIISHISDEKEVSRALSSYGFVRASFPKDTGRASEELVRLKRELRAIRVQRERVKTELSSLAERLDDIEILYDVEQTSLNILDQEMKLGATEHVAMLEAWVPEAAEKKVSACLEKFDAAYEFREPKDYETPPTLLSNNGFAKNFEWVIGMYSYPKYGSFDPTFIMSIFYFLLFGIMFADVGYGLLLVVLGFGAVKMMRPQESMKRFLLMFAYCGISSAFMGALFGGWFGDLPFALMTNLLGMENAKMEVPFFNGVWFNPLDDPMQFLIVSLGIGAAHLIAGMAVKFYVICRSGKILDAIFDVGSWWVLFAGIALIFVNGTAGACVTVAGVLMLVLTQGRHEKNIFMKLVKGVGSLYDLVSYLSDLLSYSRILALGMVAGVIGQVVNMITGLGDNIFGFIIMLAVLLVGHVLNLAINVLGTFVHTSRLQYIEFFNKFYEDGGKPFEAAVPSEKYTIEK